MWHFWAFRQMHLADLTCRSITAHCLYDNWLSPYCRITTRFPCCARTLRSVKTDAAASAWLSLECSVCWNGKVVTPTSALQQHIEIRQLPEDRHLCGDAWVFSKWNDTQRPLSTERIAVVQWDDASDSYSLCHYACLQDEFRYVRHLTARARGCV